MANGERAGPKISKGGSGLPSRVIMHAVEGLGKTSLGACSVKPVFILSRGETGLLTLIDNGLVPETNHFDECLTWSEVLACVAWLIDHKHDSRTLVIDTINGLERLCFEHVCEAQYGGSWQKFADFAKGPEVAQQEWLKLMALLDKLRSARCMAIIALCHTRVKTYKNPLGDDYDRFQPDMNDKTWGLTHKWADVVLFGNFETFAEKSPKGSRPKGIGGRERILYTQRSAAWDAKNRLGLPPEIRMGRTSAEGWANFYDAMRLARANGNKPAQAPGEALVPVPEHTETSVEAAT